MKQLASAIAAMSQSDISTLEKTGEYTFDIEGNSAVITKADVEIISEDIPGWLVANEGNITVALDITVTPELKQEGIARELVNRIQNIRKSNGYTITDKIKVVAEKNPETDEAITAYGDYIAKQVLATEITLADKVEGECTDLDFDGFILKISITKS